MGVTVADSHGQLVSDLTADDFEIEEDGVPQPISYFGVGSPTDGALDLHVGILLDVSRSMADDLDFMRTASIRFLRRLPEAVDITVVDFDAEVRIARFGPSDFPRVVERIRQQKLGGDTALYDAVGLYLDGAFTQPGRKIVLVYTDGGDTRSALRRAELLDVLKAADVTLYGIGVFEPRSDVWDRLALEEFAAVTGGKAFFPSGNRDLDRVYDEVLAEVRAQYTLGYVSTNDRLDGTWRDVTIRVVRGDSREYRVRTRPGYYALLREASP